MNIIYYVLASFWYLYLQIKTSNMIKYSSRMNIIEVSHIQDFSMINNKVTLLIKSYWKIFERKEIQWKLLHLWCEQTYKKFLRGHSIDRTWCEAVFFFMLFRNVHARNNIARFDILSFSSIKTTFLRQLWERGRVTSVNMYICINTERRLSGGLLK